jgi:hypothetical protein
MSIFDDEVRAGMNSYQAAMAKGMPPDQAEAYTHGLDVLGILDYTQLPAVLRQFQQMKQPPAQQLATPNVAQQIQMLANARQGGRGLGAIRSGTMPYGPTSYVPPPVADPMMRGLGAMDAGAMENPKGFNMGGIVAFAGKDNEQLVQSPPIRAANLPRTDQEMFNYFYGLVGDGGEAAYKKARELREQREREAGVGEFAKSFEEEQALLDTEEREAAGQTAQDIEDLGRQESADIAGAAAGSRSYLEAVSKARSKAVERERDFTVKVREATAARNRARIALTKAKETAKATGLASDKAAVEKAEERLIATERRLEDTSNRRYEADLADRRARERAEENRNEAERVARRLGRIKQYIVDEKGNRVPNPEWVDTFNLYKSLYTGKRGISQYDSSRLTAAQNALRQARDAAKVKTIDDQGNEKTTINENDPNVIARKRELQAIENELRNQGIDFSSGVTSMTAPSVAGGSGSAADYSDDALKTELGIP